MPSKNRIDLLIALANFASDYHSGQFSRGYRLSCLAQKRLRSLGLTNRTRYGMHGAQVKIYNRLVRTYADKM